MTAESLEEFLLQLSRDSEGSVTEFVPLDQVSWRAFLDFADSDSKKLYLGSGTCQHCGTVTGTSFGMIVTRKKEKRFTHC